MCRVTMTRTDDLKVKSKEHITGEYLCVCDEQQLFVSLLTIKALGKLSLLENIQ